MIDITKFQNFVITIVLVVAYVALAIQTIVDADTAAAVAALPGFSGTFLTLLGISHAGYVLGNLPPERGEPAGLTVKNRSERRHRRRVVAPTSDSTSARVAM